MTKIIGIDDAGRGPAIGPMILAGVLIEKADNKKLQDLGAKDSKLLTTIQRKRIGDHIKENYKHHIEISQPIEIDESTNLNYLEAIKSAKIINTLTKDLKEKVNVIIDCPSVNIGAWTEDVQKLIKKPEIINLSCEHKADARHPSVSAASIIAKEKREEEVARLKKELKVDFGSGYPADPKTKDFLKENHDDERYQEIIRFSWGTIKKLKEINEDKKRKKLF